MVKNHVADYFPKDNVTGVALDAPVSVKFDNAVQSVNTSQLFYVTAGSSDSNIQGLQFTTHNNPRCSSL